MDGFLWGGERGEERLFQERRKEVDRVTGGKARDEWPRGWVGWFNGVWDVCVW
jgi:hypothetical protein